MLRPNAKTSRNGFSKNMTVTILTKPEIKTTEDVDENETCCTQQDELDEEDKTFSMQQHAMTFVTDLRDYVYSSLSLKKDHQNEDFYDEIYYEKSKQLLSYDDAPEYLKHNSFILSGYRSILNTRLCIESVFWWTNESINIWSHIFGYALFVGLTINDLLLLKVQASLSDKFIVGAVLICFQVCMLLSSLYHTFSCRSSTDCDIFLSFDLFGIALSLLAIYTSGIYYAFWCNSDLQNFYLSTVTFIFVIAMILQIPQLNINTNVKMTVFVGWAVYGVIPTFHWAIVMGGFQNPIVSLLLPRVLGMYVISGAAFFIYITKIPERFSAGRFDYIGHSHQWWHLFVVGALYYWHNTGMLYFDKIYPYKEKMLHNFLTELHS